jgi:hypothetical protein
MKIKDYSAWLQSLTKPQLKALAHQAGLNDWNKLNRGALLRSLASNVIAQDIWNEEVLKDGRQAYN